MRRTSCRERHPIAEAAVARTVAWLGRDRRLAKDHEQTVASSETFIYLGMTHLMVRRVA